MSGSENRRPRKIRRPAPADTPNRIRQHTRAAMQSCGDQAEEIDPAAGAKGKAKRGKTLPIFTAAWPVAA